MVNSIFLLFSIKEVLLCRMHSCQCKWTALASFWKEWGSFQQQQIHCFCFTIFSLRWTTSVFEPNAFKDETGEDNKQMLLIPFGLSARPLLAVYKLWVRFDYLCIEMEKWWLPFYLKHFLSIMPFKTLEPLNICLFVMPCLHTIFHEHLAIFPVHYRFSCDLIHPKLETWDLGWGWQMWTALVPAAFGDRQEPRAMFVHWAFPRQLLWRWRWRRWIWRYSEISTSGSWNVESDILLSAGKNSSTSTELCWKEIVCDLISNALMFLTTMG